MDDANILSGKARQLNVETNLGQISVDLSRGSDSQKICIGLRSVHATMIRREGLAACLPAEASDSELRRFALWGPPGYGKSVAAHNWALSWLHRTEEGVDAVIWIDCSSWLSVLDSLRSVALQTNGFARGSSASIGRAWTEALPGELLNGWLGWIHALPLRFIVILDSLDDPGLDLAMLPQTAYENGSMVLVTTTHPQVAGHVTSSPISVGVFERSESVAVLRASHNRGRPEPTPVEDAIAALLRDVPLAIGIAACWGRRNPLRSYQVYLDEIRGSLAPILDDQPDTYQRTVNALWSHLSRSLSPAALWTIGELAYLDTPMIAVDVLDESGAGYDIDTLTELHMSGCIIASHDGRGRLTVATHQLLAASVRSSHSELQRNMHIKSSVGRMVTALGRDGSIFEVWPAASEVDRWFESLPQPGHDSSWRTEWLVVADRLADYHLGGVENQSRATHLVDMVETLASQEEVDLRLTYNLSLHRCWLHGLSGDTSMAIRGLRCLHGKQANSLGPWDPDTLRTQHHLARWLGEAGDIDHALSEFAAALQGRTTVLGRCDRYTLNTRNHLARWWGEKGEPEKAVNLFEALVVDATSVHGDDHPSTLRIRHNFARWLGHAGRFDRAIVEFETVLAANRRLVGDDHPSTLRTRHNLARWIGLAGRTHESIESFDKIIRDRRRVLGSDHPDTLNSRHHRALELYRAGDTSEAIEELTSVLIDRTRILTYLHPQSLSTGHELALILRDVGRIDEARTIAKATLIGRRELLGDSHPDTAASEKLVSLL